MAKKLIQIVYQVTDAQLLKSAATIKANEKAAKDADAAVNKFGKSAEKAGKDAGGSFLKLGDIWKGLIAVGIVSFITNLGKKVLDLTIKQEQLNISFTTFLGSGEKAKKLLADLARFAIVTPFSPEQVNSAARALLAFGVAGRDIIPTLKLIGDISAGTGKDLTEMAIIFGQIRSTGRLMGQDLLQLINAGFNPLQNISQTTGKSMAQLKKEMEAGLISFAMVEQAFKDATSAGGLFNDLMEKQSRTVGGLLSTISGNIDEALKNIGSQSTGPVKAFVDQLVRMSEAFIQLSMSADQTADAFDTNFKTKFKATFEEMVKSFGSVEAAAEVQNRITNERIDLLEKEHSEALKSSDDTEEAQEQRLSRLRTLRLELVAIQEYIQAIKDEAKAKQDAKVVEEIQKEQAALAELLKTRKKFIEELLKEKVDEDANLPILGIPTDDEFEKIKANLAILDKELKADQRTRDEEEFNRQQEVREREVEAEEQKQKRIRDIRDAAFEYGSQLLGQFLSATLLTNEQETDSQREAYNQRIELAGDNKDAVREIRREQEEFEKEANKRSAEEQKRNQVKQMIITNLQNALRALGTPPVPNFALAGVTAAFGLGSIALANAVGFKEGVVGLQGPGTGTSDSIPARLSRGESVITAAATDRSHNLLEAINSGEIDDRILRKLQVSSTGVNPTFDDSEINKRLDKIAAKSTYDEGHFTVTRIMKDNNLIVHIKSKHRSK
jgi:tape measure domain-containing protein